MKNCIALSMLTLLTVAAPAFASPTNLQCWLDNGNTYVPIVITFDDAAHTVNIGPSNWTFDFRGGAITFDFDGPATINSMDADEIDFTIPAHTDYTRWNGGPVLTIWDINRLTGKFTFSIHLIDANGNPFKDYYYQSIAYGDKACTKAEAKF